MPRRLDKKEGKEEGEVHAKVLTPDRRVGDSPSPETAPVSVDLENEPITVREKCVEEDKLGCPPVDLKNVNRVVGIPADLEDKPTAVLETFEDVVQPEQMLQVKSPQRRDNEPIGSKKAGEDLQIVFSQQPLQFKFDGKYPSLAFNNNNQAVVVYHHSNFFMEMFSCVGNLNPADGKIEWGEEYQYDKGAYPRVAVNNSGVVVEVHESPRKKKSWYHVGIMNGKEIEWGPSYEIGHGLRPAVALSDDNQVVIVGECGNRLFSPESFYLFGKVNKVDKSIFFFKRRELLVPSGKELSISIKGNNIIVAFRDARNHGRLHTKLGKIDGQNVSWAEYEYVCFAEGNWPNVSLNNEGVVVVNCQTYINRRLLCREGQLKERDGLCYVQWSTKEAREYTHGVYPSLCLLEGNRLIEFHGTSTLNGHSMFYMLGNVRK